jgi:hypothetical protein
MDTFFDQYKPQPEQAVQIKNANSDVLNDLDSRNRSLSPSKAILLLPLAVWERCTCFRLINRERSTELGFGQFIDSVPDLEMAVNREVKLTAKGLRWLTSSDEGARSGVIELKHITGETMRFRFRNSGVVAATVDGKRLELRDGCEGSAEFVEGINRLVREITRAQLDDMTPLES